MRGNRWCSSITMTRGDRTFFFRNSILFQRVTWTLSARAFNVNLRSKLRFYYKTISGISVLCNPVQCYVVQYNNNININVIFPTTALFQTKWAYLIYNKWTRTYLRDNEWFAWFESRTVCVYFVYFLVITHCVHIVGWNSSVVIFKWYIRLLLTLLFVCLSRFAFIMCASFANDYSGRKICVSPLHDTPRFSFVLINFWCNY